jgi:hydrogenase nickel insertion protein HypA
MHEYSIVQALIEQCEGYAAENEAQQVTKVVVKIGIMSGVEPHLLEIAFETFKEKTVCENAEFVLNIQPLTITCKACSLTSELEKIAYCCPSCGSLDVNVVDGEEMLLMSLEME